MGGRLELAGGRALGIAKTSGAVTAVKAGTTTISVSTGGITSSVKLTVSR